MWFWQVQVHRIHDLLCRMRSGHRQHAGVHLAHQIAAVVPRLCTEATGHDHAAVFSQCLADRVQALLDGIVNKAAGVDDHQIGAFKCFGGLVTLGIELREDQLGIGQRFGAAEADKTDAGRRSFGGGHRGGKDLAHAPIVSERRTGHGRGCAAGAAGGVSA